MYDCCLEGLGLLPWEAHVLVLEWPSPLRTVSLFSAEAESAMEVVVVMSVLPESGI